MPVIKKNPLFYILKPVTGLMIKVSKFIVLYTISPSPMQAQRYPVKKLCFNVQTMAIDVVKSSKTNCSPGIQYLLGLHPPKDVSKDLI